MWMRATIEALCNQLGSSTVYPTMKTFILAIVCALLAACASSRAEPAPSSSQSPMVALTCYRDLVPTPGDSAWLPSSYCPAEEVAVETAVAHLGFPARSVRIEPFGFQCAGPFPSGPQMACPSIPNTGLTADVTFAGTPEVAALNLALDPDGQMVATIVAYAIPPAGWSLP